MMKAIIKKDDQCAEGGEMHLGAVPALEAQNSRKECITSTFTVGTPGSSGSGGHSVSFHVSSLGRSGSGM